MQGAKLSRGQIAVLRHCLTHEAVLIWATTNPAHYSFWESLPGASPSTFHSLVRRGLLRVENRSFHYITDEGKEALKTYEPKTLVQLVNEGKL